jgi:hypothetical protein
MIKYPAKEYIPKVHGIDLIKERPPGHGAMFGKARLVSRF